MRRSSAPIAFALSLGMIGGCQCTPTGFEQQHYACDTDRDCLDGWTCVAGFCESTPGTGGGSGGGAGGGGMGGGAGGGGGTADGGCAAVPEICGNSVDENCNGILDDGCPCTGIGQPCYRDGLDSPSLRYPWDGGAGCSAGLQACVNGAYSASCTDEHVPQVEYCDGMDTDCDGLPDPVVCACQQGKACYLGPPGTLNADPGGKTACWAGLWNCSLGIGLQCVGQVLPAARETCNGLDDDCNGLVDDQADTQPCGPGVCSAVNRTCVDGGQPACDLTGNPPPNYSTTEICADGLDNNCNNSVEEGCTCVLDAGVKCWTGSSSACPTDGGTCKGICVRGNQTCQTQSDGGTGYSACSGQTLPATENCSDGIDNDCDGLIDCADSDCSGRSCNATGRICSGGSCQCVLDGGTVQSSESICNDSRDNDCDGLTDCAEAVCANQSCGSFGRACVGTQCSCTVDGGTVQTTGETLCDDGRDNDCDGLIDCAESACAGATCAAGKTCVSGACNAADAGTVQSLESICNDGFDNDSDGLTDCLDPGCDGRTCAANGFRCNGTACQCSPSGGSTQFPESTCYDTADNDCDGLTDCADPSCLNDAGVCKSETNCQDGVDNDQDGQTDCADSDCSHKSCSGTSASSVCCGTSCINVGADPSNCGNCGIVCGSGTCQTVSGNGHTSGRCACPTDGGSCPRPGSNTQDCNSGYCDCNDESNQCKDTQGGKCQSISGADFCYYP